MKNYLIKLLVLCLVLSMSLSFVACNNDDKTNTEDEDIDKYGPVDGEEQTKNYDGGSNLDDNIVFPAASDVR